MALLLSNRDAGKTDEKGHLIHLSKIFGGDVVEGFSVSQSNPVAMSVDVAAGSALIDSGAGYSYNVFSDAVETVSVDTADPANPRKDIVVLFVDKSVAPDGNSNNPNIVKLKVVAGTPAASPSDPSDSDIQSSIGAGNPFIKLARIDVAAGVTTISSGSITDLRTFAGVNTANITDGSITNAKLSTTAGEPGGAWQSWTPTYNAGGAMTWTSITTHYAAYLQVGKRVYFRIKATGTTGGAASNSLAFTLPVIPHAEYGANNGAIGAGFTIDGSSTPSMSYAAGTATVYVRKYDLSNYGLGTQKGFSLAGVYEAA